ncbi:hypothetical protein CLOLEP_02640 [[Clostridium] leptum DSM 753]|uniref:Uncharacterized protein n=1 Tax=[Clostridium] leptum DSM 753 TaxID=428125 RepID=A7VVM8_9FIRM|nr:hypothetical protein CLOLEP_02640 [[Clostridium] leptum DSM 753]
MAASPDKINMRRQNCRRMTFKFQLGLPRAAAEDLNKLLGCGTGVRKRRVNG